MPDKSPTTEERLSAMEDRLDAMEAKLAPKKTAPVETAISIVRRGAAKNCHFNTSPEVAKDLAKRFPRRKEETI